MSMMDDVNSKISTNSICTANGVTASITASGGRPLEIAYVELYHVTSLNLLWRHRTRCGNCPPSR